MAAGGVNEVEDALADMQEQMLLAVQLQQQEQQQQQQQRGGTFILHTSYFIMMMIKVLCIVEWVYNDWPSHLLHIYLPL
jgi:hypothetical protein